jgi:hypothetical protein
MIKCGDRWINPDHVSTFKIDHRFYMNGSATYLDVTMVDGTRFTVEHGHGVDVFALEKQPCLSG